MKIWFISMPCKRSLRNMVLLLAGCCLAWTQTPSTGTPAPKATSTPTPPPADVIDITPSQTDFDATKPWPATDESSIKILSDTMGVDFGPYMKRLKTEVQHHWEPLVPESARPPMMKSGLAVIEFSIMKDGAVRGMKLVQPSGDFGMDRAAWGAITSSMPFPAFPQAFKGEYLLLRCRFLYNPQSVVKSPIASPQPTPQPKQEPPK